MNTDGHGFNAKTPRGGHAGLLRRRVGEPFAIDEKQRVRGGHSNPGDGVGEHWEKDGYSYRSVCAEVRQRGDGQRAGELWTVGHQRKNAWQRLWAKVGQGLDTSVSPHEVERSPRESGEFRDCRAGLRTKDAKHDYDTVSLFRGVRDEATRKLRRKASDQRGDFGPPRRRFVTDPLKKGRDGIGANGSDCTLSLGIVVSALLQPVDPLGERAPLVAGFAVAKKLPEHDECEDSARKKDKPFPAFRHGSQMMEVLGG